MQKIDKDLKKFKAINWKKQKWHVGDIVILKKGKFKPEYQGKRYRIVMIVNLKYSGYIRGFRISIKPNLQVAYNLCFDKKEIERQATPHEVGRWAWRHK